MNVLVMLGVMGLMMILFMGRGHHNPSPKPDHHTANHAGAHPGQPASPKDSKSAESTPDPAGSPKAESTPPPPPAPKGE